MRSTSVIVLHYHEIALKGRNREMFERQLIENVRWAVRDFGGVRVQRMSGRIVVRFDSPDARVGAGRQLRERLARVFGIANFLSGNEVRLERAALAEDAVSVLTAYGLRLTARTFAVRVKRGNKSYPATSQELEREIGAAIVGATGLRVDLERPDLTVHVEIVEDTAFVCTEKAEGPGGLPVGVSGRVLTLLSSGFDSPVAAWRTMKRGCVADFIHFHSAPYTSDASIRNVEEIVRVLQPWQQERGRLHLIPLIEYQKQVMTTAPAALRVLLYRRMMVRVASLIAQRIGAEALVTGESIGQVASQTIPNMAAVEAASSLPIFRPLLGYDKLEIIQQAERIGTAAISSRPYDDCCSLFTPPHPATHATAAELDAAEQTLGAGEWVERLAAATEQHV